MNIAIIYFLKTCVFKDRIGIFSRAADPKMAPSNHPSNGMVTLGGKNVRNIEMGCLHCHDPLPLAISPKLIDEVGAYWFQLPFF